jgi:DNA-binding response OmpR family regulator
MLSIIIVEDNKHLRDSLFDVMVAEGHQVMAFESAEALWSSCNLESIDIIILDLNLPGEDGITVARRIRAQRSDVGIIMLTARSEPQQRQIGYESGADIYLAKPSSVPELTSSIRALARRLGYALVDAEVLILDTVSMTLNGPSDKVPLSSAEVTLLEEFARAPERRLGTCVISNIVAAGGDLSKAAIEVRIVRLRKKILAAGFAGQPINVVRNQGYQLSVRIRVV